MNTPDDPFAGTTFETRQERGARAERAAIVAWLREEAERRYNGPAPEVFRNIADAISRGDHLKDR